MSSSTSVYFGPYVKIKRDVLQMVTTKHGCSKCNTESSSKFCPECGTGISRIEIKQYHSLGEILDSMGKKWGLIHDVDEHSEWQGKIEGKNYDSEKYTIAIFSGNYCGDYRSVTDLDEMPKASEEQVNFIEEFNKKFGDESMTLHYGVIVDYN